MTIKESIGTNISALHCFRTHWVYSCEPLVETCVCNHHESAHSFWTQLYISRDEPPPLQTSWAAWQLSFQDKFLNKRAVCKILKQPGESKGSEWDRCMAITVDVRPELRNQHWSASHLHHDQVSTSVCAYFFYVSWWWRQSFWSLKAWVHNSDLAVLPRTFWCCLWMNLTTVSML